MVALSSDLENVIVTHLLHINHFDPDTVRT